MSQVRNVRSIQRESEQGTGQSKQNLYQGSWRERIKAKFQWEDLVVNGREVKGFVISPAIAAVVLAFMLGLCATIYWRLSDQITAQRDLIVELKTSLRDSKDADAEYRKETKDQIALLKVYIDNLREKQVASDARKGHQ